MKAAILVVPGPDGTTTSVLVLDPRGTRALWRVNLALDLGGRQPPARSPPAPRGELKVGLDGELLCLEYREP